MLRRLAGASPRITVVAVLAVGCLASCGGSASPGASGAATSGDANVPVEVDLSPVPSSTSSPTSSAAASAPEAAASASASTAPPVRTPAALDDAKTQYVTHTHSLIRRLWNARCDADEGAVASGTITLTGLTVTSVSDPSLDFLVGATLPAPPEEYPDLSIPSVSVSLRCAKKKVP